MSYYKLKLDLGNRPIEVSMKEGTLATVEIGQVVDGVEKAQKKITAILQSVEGEVTAWVQVSDLGQGKSHNLVHEGWVRSRSEKSEPFAGFAAISAKIEPLDVSKAGNHVKCLEEAKFGILACCTSNGSGCYVRCCGGCCSDPTGCPGASCCP